ncbi:MAG: phosphatidate cytidylyltransferase, partial [Bacteroidales bacterium]|nr:phosphatidate cytidylyltransferase [Bacteroidales bacterium]MCF8343744.1 phosphatidate cytidylyltransferase [Bacteroidales bacterium]MCF8377870.1 phosphatidate cytidylyltransferase [Bacteroidales bacterium]
DVFAYVVGSLIGRRKLFRQISPGKTWEGTLGGALITFGLAWLIAGFFQVFLFEQWAVITAIIIIFGTLGDLTESMIKRSVNIKDSGTIIPGHGGVLDRFDGVLFSAPMVLIYLLLFT